MGDTLSEAFYICWIWKLVASCQYFCVHSQCLTSNIPLSHALLLKLDPNKIDRFCADCNVACLSKNARRRFQGDDNAEDCHHRFLEQSCQGIRTLHVLPRTIASKSWKKPTRIMGPCGQIRGASAAKLHSRSSISICDKGECHKLGIACRSTRCKRHQEILFVKYGDTAENSHRTRRGSESAASAYFGRLCSRELS